MPLDGARQQVGLLAQLLGVVLAKVGVAGGIQVQGEDVVGGLELGHGDEADLRVCQWEGKKIEVKKGELVMMGRDKGKSV